MDTIKIKWKRSNDLLSQKKLTVSTLKNVLEVL